MSYIKGPWEIAHYEDGILAGSVFIRDEANEKSICHISSGLSPQEEIGQEANARLISSAPDLLEACEEFVRKVECGEARSVRSYAQMKAAIAKARGER
ncbi:MAG: hypothetical protein M0Q43_10335 [Methanothrix sp.]|jgi:hypothetical protein|nr:hypothetical protein [Methanothrix sp.]